MRILQPCFLSKMICLASLGLIFDSVGGVRDNHDVYPILDHYEKKEDRAPRKSKARLDMESRISKLSRATFKATSQENQLSGKLAKAEKREEKSLALAQDDYRQLYFLQGYTKELGTQLEGDQAILFLIEEYPSSQVEQLVESLLDLSREFEKSKSELLLAELEELLEKSDLPPKLKEKQNTLKDYFKNNPEEFRSRVRTLRLQIKMFNEGVQNIRTFWTGRIEAKERLIAKNQEELSKLNKQSKIPQHIAAEKERRKAETRLSKKKDEVRAKKSLLLELFKELKKL